MENTEEQFNHNLQILEKHYTLFDFPKANIFISLFEEGSGKSIVIDEYSKIAHTYQHQVFVISNEEELNKHLVNIKKEANHEGKQPVFDKTTFIFDTENNNELLMSIINHFYDLHKYSHAKMHFLSHQKQLRDIISVTDIWQFRDNVFHFPQGFVDSLYLKNKMLEELPESQNTTKKMKV